MLDDICNDDFRLLDSKMLLVESKANSYYYKHFFEMDNSTVALYNKLFSWWYTKNAWNLERLNRYYVTNLQKYNRLDLLFNFRWYLIYAFKGFLPKYSKLYQQPQCREEVELYIIRLYRQFKAMAEYQFIIDLEKVYPFAKVTYNQMFDTMHALDYILIYQNCLAYVHIARSGQDSRIEDKKQGVGAYRFSDGTHFMTDQHARLLTTDKPNHKHIFYTIGIDGFVFDKSQFYSLFDTHILWSGLSDLLKDHDNLTRKVHRLQSEKVPRKWETVTDIAERLTYKEQ